MADIVITEFMDEASIRDRLGAFDVIYDPGLVDRPDELLERVADARALVVRNRTQVRGALLAAAARLECIGRLGVGLDNIDVDACKARSIAVYPATGANDLAVAEYVIAAALILLRGAYRATDRVIAGEWPRQDLIGNEASGRTMGLVGFGAIARQVASRAGSLGMHVVAYDPYLPEGHEAWNGVARGDLSSVLATADVLSLHTPLSEETRRMIDAAAIGTMKPGAVLVNAARGGIVDEEALCEALREGRLGGAALDVFETEPLDAAAGRRFEDIANLILTPHIAGVTGESNVRVGALIAERVATHLKGPR